MAGKLLANLIVIGGTYLARGVVEGYRRALANAKQSGVAHETLQNVRNASKAMTEQEARRILGASVESSWEDVLQKYNKLFENNAKAGSFYLQSKVHRAKESLEMVYSPNDKQTAG